MDELGRNRIINSIYEVIRGNTTLVDAWGFYLFDPEFENEPELRNRLMVIYLGGVFDLTSQELEKIPRSIKVARDAGFDVLAQSGEQIMRICRVAARLLSEFTESEQLFIIDLRNQYVHGYLAGIHNERISRKIIIDSRIVYRYYSYDEYHKYIRENYNGRTLDEILGEFRERALSSWPAYWGVIGQLRANRDEIYKALREDTPITVTLPDGA